MSNNQSTLNTASVFVKTFSICVIVFTIWLAPKTIFGQANLSILKSNKPTVSIQDGNERTDFSLVGILFLAINAFSQTKLADYNGDWLLDQKQSKDLPAHYANVKSHKLSVTQTDRQLTAATELAFGGNEPVKFQLTFNLDGRESTTESVMQTGVRIPSSLSAKNLPDGKLRLTISRNMALMDSNFKAVTTEDWELGKDARILTIHKVDENTGKRMASTMVFTKSEAKKVASK